MSEQELDTVVEETPPETSPPAAPPETPAPAAAAPPHEDVEGIKSALIAERRRRQELEQEVQTLRTPPAPKPPDIPDVSDEEAEKVARHYELYAKDGLDISRAKRIIKDQRDEIRRVAKESAEEAVAPVRQGAATAQSRQNFVWAATQKDSDGQPLVDHKALAEIWATFPAELSANPEVAKVILKAAIGETVMTRGPKPRTTVDREPGLSEPSGGNRTGAYTMSNLEKKVATGAGIKSADWEARAKTYQPGAPNSLE